jgi:LysR family nitrogen assimilation transcriptional regulator
MDFKEMRYFAHVARAGSFSRAASELRIAQPALSRQIRKLEDRLGVALLVRHGRGVRLTSAGVLLLEGAETLSDQLSRLDERVRSGGDAAVGHVSLGVPPAAGLLVVPPTVERFAAAWPRVTLHVREGISSSLQEWLLDGRIDIAVLHTPPPLQALNIVQVLREQMVLVAPAADSRGAVHFPGESVRLRDLTEIPLIMPGLPHSNRRLLDQAAIQHGVRLRIVLEVDSVALTKALVMRGAGHSVLTAAAVHEEVAQGKLRAFPIDRPPLTSTLAIANLRSAQSSPPAEALKRTLRDVIHEFVDTGVWKGASRRIGARG